MFNFNASKTPYPNGEEMSTTKIKAQNIEGAWQIQEPSGRDHSNRRKGERRTQESKGYTYISMVGWMDRREKNRRKDDASSFF
jgi:hypothetical protein